MGICFLPVFWQFGKEETWGALTTRSFLYHFRQTSTIGELQFTLVKEVLFNLFSVVVFTSLQCCQYSIWLNSYITYNHYWSLLSFILCCSLLSSRLNALLLHVTLALVALAADVTCQVNSDRICHYATTWHEWLFSWAVRPCIFSARY